MHRVNSKDLAGVNPSAYNPLQKLHNYGTTRRLNYNYGIFLNQLIQNLVKLALKFLDQNTVLGKRAKLLSNLTIYSLQTFTKQYKRYLISHNYKYLPEVEPSKTSLASRTRFDVLGLGVEASSPQKLPCPQLENRSIF